MTLGGILVLLLLLVSLIVFIYFIVVTARTWGVLHSILLCTLFIECWVFMVFTAGVHDTRVRATEQAAINKDRAERALANTTRLTWGSIDAADIKLEAVVPVKGRLRRMTADRGRVWRAVNFVQAGASDYQLELSAGGNDADDLLGDPDAADANESQPTSESLPVDLVVYAFAEEVNEEGQPIPVFYLGEYTVTQSQAGAVTLQPTLPLRSTQTDLIASGTALTWTLYELLPLDSHGAFAAPGSQPSDEAIFGRMDDEAIAVLLANVPEDSNRQQKLIAEYLRDGQRAAEDDPSASVWVQVNILKDYEVDVDSQEVADATERGHFDILGRAIDVRLQRQKDGARDSEDGNVKLTPNTKERIVLKEEVAQPLIDNGTVQLEQRIFVRPLNDYAGGFNRQHVRRHELRERSELFKRESARLGQANHLGQEMISFRQVENQELAADLTGYEKEVAVLNEAVDKSAAELAQIRSDLSKIYRAIQARRSQMIESTR